MSHKPRSRVIGGLGALLIVATAVAAGQTKQEIEGIRNFTRVSPAIGCGGATAPEAVPALKEQGFTAIVNFRLATEENARVDEERAAAEAAGLSYFHVPFSLTAEDAPDPYGAVNRFLTLMADNPDASLFIHCNSANRVGAMWMIKRVLQDGWTVDRALEEAKAIGLTNQKLQDFALEYLRVHRPAGP